MLDARQVLFDFVLEQAEQQPVAKRIQLYRALAEYVGSEEQKKQLHALADSLSAAQRQASELAFFFHHAGGKKP